MQAERDPVVLHRALDQLAGLLDEVPGGALSDGTPCAQWSVQDLIDHIVAAPSRFARMVRAEGIDWSAPTPSAGPDPAAQFRSNAEDLLRAVREHVAPDAPVSPDWQCAELAVHTWDLAAAIGRSTSDLDAEVAERGLAFLRANLTETNRSPAFGPEQPVPGGADPYQRLAAFSGRSV
jgi:uncharacterized protein (TIGR03086 family)